MKKLFLLLALFSMLAVGCEELFPTEQSPNATPVFSTDVESSYIVDAEGEEITVMVTTNIDYSVVIPEDAEEWLSVADTRAVIREETLTFIVAENKAYDRRSTTVTLVDNEGNALQAIEFIQRAAAMPQSACPSDEIWYTTTNGEVVEPYSGEENNYADALTTFGANIISNTYIDGKGVITFDGDVATIGDWAFYGFTSLTSITIPNSVTTIGDYTFASCNDIQNIYFGDNVQSFGEYSFHDCYALTSIYIPYGITSLDFRVLAGCRSLTEVNIPSSVTVINDSAIAGCWELKSVNIPNSVTTIGHDAFSGCSSLESVTIPDSVTTIGDAAFWYCI